MLSRNISADNSKIANIMNEYQCYQCGWETDNHEKSLHHVESEHKVVLKSDNGKEVIVCDMCSFTAGNMAEVKVHIKAIHKKDEWNWMTTDIRIMFNCNDCEQNFVTKKALDEHVKIVHEEKKNTLFVCDFCEKPFPNNKQRGAHMTFVHTQKSKDIPCWFCDKICSGKKDLCDHISLNHSEAYVKEEPKDVNTEAGEIDAEIVVEEEKQTNYNCNSWDDGFSFGGKRKEFAQATLEIQKLFHTNKLYELDGVKFSLVKKEKETKGTCVNYLIKVETGQETGKAMMKAWDKNSKNEYKVVVSKVKESEISFVKTLAKVITTLLDKSISGEGWSQMKSKNTVKCDICDKCFSSISYLVVD